ncbi:MAG: hypothetical protein EZS28_005114, partial [Streblomastix strix]
VCDRISQLRESIPVSTSATQSSSSSSTSTSSAVQQSLLQFNLDDQLRTLKQKFTAMLMRGIYTLEAEISRAMKDEGSRHLSEIIIIVMDRFQYDAKIMIRRLTLDILHLALDPPFIKEGMLHLQKTKLASASQRIPASLSSLFKIDLIMEDVLYDLAEKHYTHRLHGKLQDQPEVPNVRPIGRYNDVDEDLLWTFH